MKTHSSQQSVVASASTEATGYLASNVAITQTRRSWRSTVTTESTVTLDCSASITPASLCLQDVNFATATIAYSADNISYTNVGTFTSYADINGRRKGSIEFSNPCRYIRITIASGTPTDALAYWSIGAAYVFTSVQTADMAPAVGLTIDPVFPQASYDLPNGRSVTAELGSSYMQLSGVTNNLASDDSGELVRLARAATIWIDMEISANRERQWPVGFFDGRFSQSIDEALWPTSFSLKEIV